MKNSESTKEALIEEPPKSPLKNSITSCIAMGITHFMIGLVIFFLMLGMFSIPALTVICMIYFALSGVFFIVVAKLRLFSISEDQSKYVRGIGIFIFFSAFCCIFVNRKWFPNSPSGNRIPFYIPICTGFFLHFTSFLVVLLCIISSDMKFTLFDSKSSILLKCLSDLVIGVTLALIFGISYVESGKSWSLEINIGIVFTCLPGIVAAIIGFFLDKTSQAAQSIAGPADNL